MLQTITTQPFFFIQFETLYLFVKLNFTAVTGATVHIARTSRITK